MLHRLLKQSDWSFLLDFVSPAFFKIIPPFELVGQATALAKRTQNHSLYAALIEDFCMSDRLTVLSSGMNQDESKQSSNSFIDLSSEQRCELATLIVDLYFAQLYAGRHMLLDLRLSRFHFSNGAWVWSPAPLIGEFDSKFLAAMCQLYEGFYLENRDTMVQALSDLGLEWAFDTFIHHFGEGDQTHVEFKISHFVQTFHDIFMSAKEKKKSLKGDFVQLGVALGLMYETLEKLAEPVNVRASFQRVQSKFG
jgi:hypothetical protein